MAEAAAGVLERSRKNEQKLVLATPEFKKPDGGWGWVVVIASCIIMALVTGMQKSYGIYMISIMRQLELTVTQASLIQGVGIAVAFLAGEMVCGIRKKFRLLNVVLFRYLLWS